MTSQENKPQANPPTPRRDKRGGKTSLEVAERRRQVVDARDRGDTWADIAKHHNIGTTQAVRDYHRALADVPAEAVKEHRINHNERLEWLWEKTQNLINTDPAPAAVNAAVNVLNRQAKLNGLDAPELIQVEATTDLAKIVDRIKALTQPGNADPPASG